MQRSAAKVDSLPGRDVAAVAAATELGRSAGELELVMTTLPELHPVVEAPWFDGAPSWPWPVADRRPFEFIQLSGAMTELDVASVIAQLVDSNGGEAVRRCTSDELLARVIESDSLLLPGGVQASDTQRIINPSCCSGLEEWRTWLECLASGESPWMGHDPTPWIEWERDSVLVWSDGGFGSARKAWAIEFERKLFVAELKRVERELQLFLTLVEAWAKAMNFSNPQALCQRLDIGFEISGSVIRK